MNPIDHPHGGGEGKTFEGEILFHRGELQLKVIKQDQIKELIS